MGRKCPNCNRKLYIDEKLSYCKNCNFKNIPTNLLEKNEYKQRTFKKEDNHS